MTDAEAIGRAVQEKKAIEHGLCRPCGAENN